jgi:hypothetical protein
MFTGLLLLAVAFPLGTSAQDAAINPMKALAPYVDEFTFAAGVLDVQNVDLDAMLARLARVGAPRDDIAQFKQHAAPARAALLAAGGRHVCFAFNLADGIGAGPLLVIPTGKGGKSREVADLFTKLGGLEARIQGGDTVLAGRAATVQRATTRTASAMPDLAKAFAAVEPMPTRLAFTVPPALRKSLEELVPTLPKELGGGPIGPLTRDVSWAAVGMDLSAGKLQLRTIVQAQHADSAGKVGQIANTLLEHLRQEANAHQLPDLARGLQAVRPKVDGAQIWLALDAEALDTAVLPIIARVRESASRARSLKNLSQIVIAMHSYHEAHKSFPAQASYDSKERPLLSWRVHLLPFLGHQALYDRFKLDEPWDSAHNKTLIAKMPAVYHSPFLVAAEAGKTSYLVPTGPDLIFDGPKTTKIAAISDGTSNTILVVEAVESRAVWWTEPGDYKVDRKDPKAGLVQSGATGILTGFADGSVRTLSATISGDIMWLLLCPNDGMSIPDIDR